MLIIPTCSPETAIICMAPGPGEGGEPLPVKQFLITYRQGSDKPQALRR